MEQVKLKPVLNNDVATQPELVETYTERKLNNRKVKKQFSKMADDDSKRKTAITNYWVNSIADSMFFHWQGTPWNFNGVTTVPRQGTIACGYFVTTVLRDMGVKLNRVQLAICASSEMMKQLTPGQKTINLSDRPLQEMRKTLLAKGKAVYIIGLDFHTGFIICDANEVWFVHSYFVNEQGVIKEKITESASLESSKIKWLVSLTGDDEFVKKWLADK